jgi:serine/threonine-protein kinase HipA
MVSPKKRGRGARHPHPLVVWTNGQVVGDWSVREGEHRFQYADDWIASPAARRLSLSLPLTPGNVPLRGPAVENYFDNLLPDNDSIRRRLQGKFATASTDAFDLLTAIGRECVGAVQLLQPGAQPVGFDRIDAEPLDDTGVERAINASLATGPARWVPRRPRTSSNCPSAWSATCRPTCSSRWKTSGSVRA